MKKASTNKEMKPSHSSSIFQEKLFSPFLLLVFILISLVIFYSTDYCYISSTQFDDDDDGDATNQTTPARLDKRKLPFAIGEGKRGCDMFSGKWVRDYTRPLYEESDCSYIEPQLTCLEHGRPEKDFRFWRWQPHTCSIPRFNATLMLEALRGKRLMFVGDSLNRGHWTSLVCLLQKVIPENAKSMKMVDSLNIFKAKDYNATIEFYWAPFLLQSNADDPLIHRVTDRIIRNNSMDYHGKHWKEADVLIFNTYIWWISGVRILRGSFEDEVKDLVRAATREDAYGMTLRSLAEWISNNVDPTKQRVFFATMSPTHQWSQKWGGDSSGNCYNETTMIDDPTFFGAERTFMPIIIEELGKSTVPITLINITQLSSARKDAHTSIYKEQLHPISEEQLANPISYADCIHWCLPGLQDIWNEIFFAQLLYP